VHWGIFGQYRLLNKSSHGTPEPHHFGKPCIDNFSVQMNNFTNLSNCKQERSDTIQGCFLSVNDDSVVLPDQLRPAPPIDFIPTTLRGSRCAPFSVLHQHSASDLFYQIHFSLRRAPFSSTVFTLSKKPD